MQLTLSGRMDRAVNELKSATLKVIVSAILMVAVSSGCIMIPKGQPPKMASLTTSRDLVFFVDGNNQIQVAPPTVSKKYFVVGFYPGFCANWCVGEPMGKTYGEDVGNMVFAVPLINVILAGLPTICGWFGEGKADWKPPKETDSSRFGTTASLIGWSKGGKESAQKRGPPAEHVGRFAIVSLPETGDSQKVWPDKDGRFWVDCSRLFPPAVRPWALRIELTAVGRAVSPAVRVVSVGQVKSRP